MSYLSKKQSITQETLPPLPPNTHYVIGRKCRCNSAWCPSCGVRSVRRGLFRLRSWDWRRVRTVMVSLDRDLFPGGPGAALDEMEKGRSAFVRELNRTGAGIEDYQWFLEWHRDGFPHFHFFFLVSQVGRDGQIGEDRIHAAWPHGEYIRESWVKSEDHWRNWVGYALKTGYMHKDGKHQVQLPDWAKSSTRRVRRTGGALKLGENPKTEDLGPDLADWIRVAEELNARGDRSASPVSKLPPPKTNGEVLSGCGFATVLLTFKSRRGDLSDWGLVSEPYSSFIKRPGFYVERCGYTVIFTSDELLEYYRKYSLTSAGPHDGDRARCEPQASEGDRA